MPKNAKIPFAPSRDILSYEEMLRVAKVCVSLGMDKIRVTGGEPTTRPGVLDFLRALTRLPGLTDAALSTNGVYLSEMAQEIFDAGVHRINVSLDSLDRFRYQEMTGFDDLEKTLKGLEVARAAGFSPIKINCVLVRGLNCDEILDFAQLAYEEPYEVRFIEFMPLSASYGVDWSREKVVENDWVRERIGEHYHLISNDIAGPDDPARTYRIVGGRGKIGFISSVSEPFCSACSRLRMTATGKIRPCLMSDLEIDIRDAISQGEEALAARIQKIVAMKPERHHINDPVPGEAKTLMSAIGG